jgi:hypothetical protein
MKLIYTITNGRIECGEYSSDLNFALIFEEDGVINIETFITDQNFYAKTEKIRQYHKITGVTEKGYDIVCYQLFCNSYNYQNQKAKFTCNYKITLTNNKDEEKYKEDNSPIEKSVFFIELDGLKTKFADFTRIEKHRRSEKIDDFLATTFDHTNFGFLFNHPDIIGNYYSVELIENPENKNIIVDLRKKKGYCEITNIVYENMKKEFLSLLSFINGANVRIRKELKGYYYTNKGNNNFDSQDVTIFSFKNQRNLNCNDYFPINEHHSYSSEIFSKMFFQGFDKFYHLNKDLDFLSLIFSLNSTNTNDINERYFILITALERICSNFKKISNNSTELIDGEIYKNKVKPRFKELLNTLKKEINIKKKSAWDIYSSKIGDLNRRNNKDTKQKIYEFFEYSKITLNESVINLVENERNSAVHEGKIGESDEEEIKNYLKLDHILRDCIANLLEYNGKRNRKYDYTKE